MANNNVPEITSVTSETLQAQIRQLLPSQQGFGNDLMAQNVIVPIIDLTAAAEGSIIGSNLQTAIAFGSQTAFDVTNTTTVIANTTGFWRIFGTYNIFENGSTAGFSMSDGLSTKTVWNQRTISGNSTGFYGDYDFIVFLASGESISAVSNGEFVNMSGSVRQIATVTGELVDPSGFIPQ